MREIKFRGMSKLTNKWIYGYYYNMNTYKKNNDLRHIIVYENSGPGNQNEHEPVVGITVGQYTGLKDKNGKEIYEGDILSYKHITYTDCSKIEIEEIEDESFIEMINYTPIASIVKPHSKNVKCFGYDSINKECLILDLTNNEVEVIGNKFENPELLG